ncbi:hypothetical protein EEB14_53835 [Rhodococcus sp. WS4]|nr:hypothetical protein EEB14_53835 [Rhodococcus sp. WS4]
MVTVASLMVLAATGRLVCSRLNTGILRVRLKGSKIIP